MIPSKHAIAVTTNVLAACLPLSISLADTSTRPATVLDDLLLLERIASEPELVTPTGICFDNRGRLLVIESHTHMRPEDYVGPSADRIRLVEDTNGDGRVDRWSTFHEGLHQAMNVESHSNGSIYVVTRAALVRLRDTDDDGKADEQTEIVRLESKATYPHNGLTGFAIAADGTLYVGLGENLGEPYRIVGRDGSEFHGGGEGGSIYRCQPDGSKLERIATGFWNPYGLCVDPYGRIFCTENDPDASPPCRLLHIVQGGDYGYQVRYGRSGRHPLQTWTGELPGTLGMLCGLGEAACEIVVHRGALWVASWGDHRIARYQIVPKGASFRATREVVVQGGADFRPVGMAVAPDGPIYFSDWVDPSYPVHGRGGLWRLSWREPPGEALPFPPPGELEQWADSLRQEPNHAGLQSSDPFVRTAAVWGFSSQDDIDTTDWAALPNPASRVGILRARQWHDDTPPDETLAAALRDPNRDVRIFAVRWIAGRGLRRNRADILKLLDRDDVNDREYLVYLAAAEWLATGQVTSSGEISDELLVRELESHKRPAKVQAIALRLLSPDNAFLDAGRIRSYITSEEPSLRFEAIRSLGQQMSPDRFDLLAHIAGDGKRESIERAEAIMALGAAAGDHRTLLERLTASPKAALAREAKRTLQLAGIDDLPREQKPNPTDIDAWLALVDSPGDADSGRRLFFSPVGPRCSVCHRFDGRGGQVGPDLTQIGGTTSPCRILTSILQPSVEMAPEYVPWLVQTDDGKIHVGLTFPRPSPRPSQIWY